MKEIGRNPIEKIGHEKIRAGGDENQGIFFYYGLTYLTVIPINYLGFLPVSERHKFSSITCY
jgi:hypothetical protein